MEEMSSKFQMEIGQADAVTSWTNVNVDGIGKGRAWTTETGLVHIIVENVDAATRKRLPLYLNVTGDPRKGHSDWRMRMPEGDEWQVDYTKRLKRRLADAPKVTRKATKVERAAIATNPAALDEARIAEMIAAAVAKAMKG